jgi:hypothetical protein
MRLLLDNGIKEAASENVTEDDEYIITANTAAGKIVQYLRSFFDDFQFLNRHPQGPLHVLATAAGEVLGYYLECDLSELTDFSISRSRFVGPV